MCVCVCVCVCVRACVCVRVCGVFVYESVLIFTSILFLGDWACTFCNSKSKPYQPACQSGSYDNHRTFCFRKKPNFLQKVQKKLTPSVDGAKSFCHVQRRNCKKGKYCGFKFSEKHLYYTGDKKKEVSCSVHVCCKLWFRGSLRMSNQNKREGRKEEKKPQFAFARCSWTRIPQEIQL